jgi:hypothetical protein
MIKQMLFKNIFTVNFGKIVNQGAGKDEPPRRKRRGINRKILNAPRGGELNPRPPQAD